MDCLCKCPQLKTMFYTNLIALFSRYFRTFSSPDSFPCAWSQLSILVSPPLPWGFLWLLSSMSINILHLSCSWLISLVGECFPLTHHFTEGPCFLVSSRLVEIGFWSFPCPPPLWATMAPAPSHPCSDSIPWRFCSCFCKPSLAVKVTSVLASLSVW